MAFYPLLVVVLIWLGLAHRDVYRHSRRALVVALGLAAIGFLLFPTAPPRMVPGLGIYDTVGMHDHDVGSFHGITYNPYAAMPSLHVGWSLIAGAGVFRAVRSRVVRGAAIVHPLLMRGRHDRDREPLPARLHRRGGDRGARDHRRRGSPYMGPASLCGRGARVPATMRAT